MSVATSTSKIAYVGNNSTVTPYAVPFPFFDSSDLVVIKTDALGVDTILALTTDYTVTGAGGTSGTVTSVAAIPATNTVTIYRDLPATQPLQYEEADDFPAASHERGLDRATYLVQQALRKLDASFKLRESDGSTNSFAKVLSALVGIGADGLAKMFTGPEIQVLLNLPATVVDQPTKTFLNAAARASAVPDFLGQVGIQLDTSVLYSSSGVTAGAWVAVPLLDGTVTAAKLAAILDLSAKTITLPNLAVTAAMLAATLDLSGKTLTLPNNVVTLTKLPDGVLTADTAGRAKLADGFVNAAKLGSDVGVCRAWVNFNGTGTVAIRAALNVSSITDNGTGDYMVNFTSALSDVNYSAVGTTVGKNGEVFIVLIRTEAYGSGSPTLMSTSQCQLVIANPSNQLVYDVNTVCVSFFR